MKKTFYTLIAMFGVLIVINSCKHEPTVDPSIIVVTPPPVPGGTGVVCFEADILPLFQSNCAKSGCHDAASHQDGYVFDTYAHIIAGQGTAARELLADFPDLDTIVTPIGGGGLIGGTSIAARAIKPGIRLFGAEPEGASDAFQSLRAGERRVDIQPNTLCDGLRATIGAINFDLLREYGVEALTVTDAETIASMRLMWERLKIVVEPSSAVGLAAILRNRDRFAGARVGVIVTGGNVDLDHLPWQS